ncbi:isoleucine--tRNA ligase [Runella aurantiaca]|uniref:isoleucine--tRNA ligase n=1 Tax=Runella aurantiaca TaxID=2282308 RepID=UPI001E3EBA4C|nr:class I tRNA ligase family protein [Runella aurantiaca]
MNYKEYKGLDYAQLGKDILEFWKENRIFEKSVEVREGAPSFTFYEGPPSANGTPGIHHVMARTIKDMFCRYKTLRGYQVKRKGGWDTHGLPIELQVEKELGIKKDDIGIKISIEDYNKKCREAVMRFTDRWLTMTEKMGYWVDMEDPYVTYKNDYIESLWWLLKQLYEKGLLYKGYTIQPYSPAAGTGLSSHELNMPGTYKDVKDTTIVAQFKIKLTGKSGYLFDAADSDNIYILAWTTTPWTLPANSALTVGKDIDYVLITTFNQYTHLPINVILAKDLVGKYFSEKGKDAKLGAYKEGDKVIPWSIVMEFKGQHLEGIQYEQLLPYVQPLEDADKAFRVILGDFVTTEDGTGVVHTAPTFGADDFRVAKANGVPGIMVRDENGKEVPIVDKQGRFVSEIGEFGGRFVKEQYYSAEEQEDPDFKPTDVLIAIKLKEENRAFKVEKYEHPYPHCWRTDKPVLYYPMDSWFIRTTALKDRLVALNNTINWNPESTGTGRFGNWLENLVDWNLSRSRYWGTPLPIWRPSIVNFTNKSENELNKVVGSLKDLETGFFYLSKENAQRLREETDQIIINYLVSLNYDNPETVLPTLNFEDFDLNNPANIDWNFTKGLLKWKENDYRIDNIFRDLCYYSFDDSTIEHIKKYLIPASEFINMPEFDLHRPFVDNLIFIQSDFQEYHQSLLSVAEEQNMAVLMPPINDNGTRKKYLVYTRETDLIDVWFDSGAMPYAQFHFPFENLDKYPQSMGGTAANESLTSYPADFISEGVDQTRGWFFTLHAIAGLLFDSVAFKNVVSTGLVLDKNGNKMSKRLGNGIDPFETIDKYGPDAPRWYMITNAEPWDNLKFNIDGVVEVQRKFFGTLFNTYNFFALYANLDGYKIEQFNRVPKEQLSELDRWIISKVFSLVKDVTEQFDNYNPTKAGRLIQDFVCDDLSNWYVRLCRRRFWQGEMTADKRAAYETLQHCLAAVAQLMSPIAPFFGEWLYRNLTDHVREESIEKNTPFKHESVHFTDWHTYDEYWVDKDLEASMQLAQDICSLVHSLRKGNKIKVRQPLSKVLIPVLSEKIREQIEHVAPIIMSEVNVKAVEFVSDDTGILKKKIKPNFKALGPKYGPKMKEVAGIINGLNAADISVIEKEGVLVSGEYSLLRDDVEIIAEDVPGWLVASQGSLTVALDVTITEELRREGLARDVVNRIQNLRKDSGFEVTDKIKITVQDNSPELAEAVTSNKDYICQEVQAVSLDLVADLNGSATEIEIDEFLLKVKIEVAN